MRWESLKDYKILYYIFFHRIWKNIMYFHNFFNVVRSITLVIRKNGFIFNVKLLSNCLGYCHDVVILVDALRHKTISDKILTNVLFELFGK